MALKIPGGGFTFSVSSVGGDWSWMVLANNIANIGQKYQVADIRTPFGPLYNTSIPIPGDVVNAMASSVVQFQQQLTPAMMLLSPSSYSITVTESDPASEIAINQFANIGALGSYMDVGSVPDSNWISANPANVVGIGKNSQGSSTVKITPSLMLATSSPYTGHINLQDNAIPPNIIPVTFNVTVLPRPTVGLSSPTVILIYSIGSGVGTSQTLTITNTGLSGSSLSFQLSKVLNQSPWLSVNPTSGGSIPSGGNVNVLFNVLTAQVNPVPGVYSESIRLTSPNATNTPLVIPVTLNVVP